MKYTCAYCQKHSCHKRNLEDAPKNCPTTTKSQEEILELYKEDENYKISKASAKIVMDNYGAKTRIMEIVEFAKEMNYKKIGLAFCFGLSKEANVTTKILESHGLEVESIICKVGSLSRNIIDIEEWGSPMCNPIAQAEFLNEKNTDLNVVLGLCVGHDSLFFKYSKAPVTVFAVKDRVLAHNPLGAIYQADGYYKNKLFK